MTDNTQPEALRNGAAAMGVELPGCSETAALPEPDTHCFDDDTQKSVWSYSEGLVRSILASDRAMRAEQPAGAQQPGDCGNTPYDEGPFTLAQQPGAAYAELPDKGLTPELTAALQRGADGVFDLLKDWHLINKDAKAGRRLWQIGRNLEGIFGCALRGDYTRASHGQAPAQAAPQQEAQEQAAVPRFNCWTTNDGDSWFDHPADSQAIYDCLGNDAKVGDEYELTAGWRSVTARYRITEVVGDGEEYEVECISHQQENTAPQPAPQQEAPADELGEVLRERDDAEDFINELLDEVLGADRPEWSNAYNRYDAMNDVRERITALHKPAVDKAWGRFESAMAAPQPSPASQGDALDAARYRWLRDCNLAKFPEINSAFYLGNKNLDTAIDAASAAQKGGS